MGRHRGDVEKPHAQGVSPISGVAPPEEHRFKPGQSGNPGGFPKGFIRLSQAYAIVSEYSLEEIKGMAEGKKPKSWPKDRKLVIPYVTAARMWLAGTPPASSEIADRTEGKVKNTTEMQIGVAADLAAFFASLGVPKP